MRIKLILKLLQLSSLPFRRVQHIQKAASEICPAFQRLFPTFAGGNGKAIFGDAWWLETEVGELRAHSLAISIEQRGTPAVNEEPNRHVVVLLTGQSAPGWGAYLLKFATGAPLDCIPSKKHMSRRLNHGMCVEAGRSFSFWV